MSSGSRFTSINPYDGQTLNEYPAFALDTLDSVLVSADAASRHWYQSGAQPRAAVLRQIADALESSRDALAELATREMGKTLASSRTEVEKCALVCRYYADNGPAMLADRQVAAEEFDASYYSYQPLGVVLAIMPWNFPYWQVFRFMAPALMAGNAVVLKHASNVSGCALAIEEQLQQAGLPEGLFRTLLVSSKDVPRIIEHPLVRAVTFTGSTNAGREVAATAGRALKKTVLELGGSDAYVVLSDADVDLAVQVCTTSRLINNGQSCIAAKRFIVHDSIYGAFAAGMTAAMNARKTGDPMSAETDVGPLARPDLCREVERQVDESVRLGAVLMCGGERKDNFYKPTVLTEVRPGMPAFDQEIFGPVAALVRAHSDEDAIELANQSDFGLGAAVFTRDVAKGESIARDRLQAGCCFVNDFVRSDPRLPFGGIKASGYGRELGEPGIHEFVNIKTVVR